MTDQIPNPLQTSNKSTNVRFFHKTGSGWVTGAFKAGSRLAPDLTAAVAARLFFTTRRTAPKNGEQEILSHARSFRIDEMAAWSWGRGPVVLLVHGWNGRATQLGGFVSPLVERGYRVVAFDAPGHGDSAGHQSSLPEMADSIRTVASQLGDVYGVIAHSMGGAATTLALSDGMEIGRAVFISPPSNPQTFLDFFSRAVGISGEVRQRVQDRVERRVGRRMSQMRADEIARRMSIPLLVIHDEDDSHVPVQFGRSIAIAWPGATLVTTEGLGHQRILRAAHVNDLAVGFIDAQERPAQAAA
ncbi:MAG: alpha/beta hydrolase [Myxococcales bacterium]|nr:alpha/beta hydrolase [Myxococcales bacterium]